MSEVLVVPGGLYRLFELGGGEVTKTVNLVLHSHCEDLRMLDDIHTRLRCDRGCGFHGSKTWGRRFRRGDEGDGPFFVISVLRGLVKAPTGVIFGVDDWCSGFDYRRSGVGVVGGRKVV
jgi:hypothetical protein